MDLHSDAPPLHSFQQDKPTLLVCWWITAFSTVIILLRLGGRFVRTERLFTEDKWAAAALIPLYMRMACVHVILLYGTNNARFDGVKLSNDEIYHKQIASGLVLLSRIFYAATYVASRFSSLALEPSRRRRRAYPRRALVETWRSTHDMSCNKG